MASILPLNASAATFFLTLNVGVIILFSTVNSGTMVIFLMVSNFAKFLFFSATSLVTSFTTFSLENGIKFNEFEELLTNDKVVKLITNEVAEKNKNFAKFETIKKITIVPEFTVENKMMTPTFKVKKNVATEAYKGKIDAMYPKD